MRIGINTRFLIKDKLEGIGIYTQEVSKRLVNMYPEHEWYFFFDRKFHEEFIFNEKIHPITLYPSARHPILWYWWFEKSIPKALKQHKIDHFFSPDSYLSLSTTVPQTLTVHDLAYEYYPETIPWLVNQYYRYYFPKFCKKAQNIISISDRTHQDLIQHYQIDQNKITTIPNGVSDDFQPLDDESQIRVQKQYSENHPYFIYVGAIHPRKNVISILKSFELLKNIHPDIPHRLILVGRKAWQNEDLMHFYENMTYKHQVIWLENISKQTLIDLIASATAMIYLSLYEGFGLPVLEAMACSTVSITSAKTTMEEIVKDAGMVVPPTAIVDISQKMYLIATDHFLRKTLENKCLQYAKEYHWDMTARRTAEVIFKK